MQQRRTQVTQDLEIDTMGVATRRLRGSTIRPPVFYTSKIQNLELLVQQKHKKCIFSGFDTALRYWLSFNFCILLLLLQLHSFVVCFVACISCRSFERLPKKQCMFSPVLNCLVLQKYKKNVRQCKENKLVFQFSQLVIQTCQNSSHFVFMSTLLAENILSLLYLQFSTRMLI